jgi:KipI family sensor histidine kinase inhibitor
MTEDARADGSSCDDLPRVAAVGDSAVALTLADTLDLDANGSAQRIAVEMRARHLPWVTDVVPALTTVTVYFDARTRRQAVARRASLASTLLEAFARVTREQPDPPRRTVEIPVCYEPPHAVDLMEVAAYTRLSPVEVIERHVAAPHRVLMIGFAPGHAYLGGLDARLAMPRRSSPRHRVEPGAVAIANAQTSIYAAATPGGWNVIGRTPLALFDPAREPVTLLEPGDAVVFAPISAADFARLAGEPRTR